jgi:hypothetical protein
VRKLANTPKLGWGIGRYSEIFLLRNFKVTHRQGTSLTDRGKQTRASRLIVHGGSIRQKNTVIFVQLLAWLPCIFPIFDEVTRTMSNSVGQLELLIR